MVSSLTHMLSSIKSLQFIKDTNDKNFEVTHRLYLKQVLFVTSLVSTAGLVIFFLKHRLLCHDMGMIMKIIISLLFNFFFCFQHLVGSLCASI